MDARIKSACSCTALMTLTKNVRNIRLGFGVLPGESKFTPVLVIIDQWVCLPEPLRSAYGFSWIRTLNLWGGATCAVTLTSNWLWCVEELVSSADGADFGCEDAISLWRVFNRTPSLRASYSQSTMTANTRSGIAQK